MIIFEMLLLHEWLSYYDRVISLNIEIIILGLYLYPVIFCVGGSTLNVRSKKGNIPFFSSLFEPRCKRIKQSPKSAVVQDSA